MNIILFQNLRASIERVAEFLDKKYTNLQYDQLENHLHIENFKNNPAVNSHDLKDMKIIIESEGSFVRNGKIGGYKDYFKGEMRKEVDEWIEENLKNIDITFPL